MAQSTEVTVTALTAASVAAVARLKTGVWLPRPDLLPTACVVLIGLGMIGAIIPGISAGRIVALALGSMLGTTIAPLILFGPGKLWPFALALGGTVTVMSLGTGIVLGLGVRRVVQRPSRQSGETR